MGSPWRWRSAKHRQAGAGSSSRKAASCSQLHTGLPCPSAAGGTLSERALVLAPPIWFTAALRYIWRAPHVERHWGDL